jgi:uncharacterized protein (DUF1330 family)
MTAYMIVEIEVHDARGFEEYRERVPALIRKYGGEYLARGGESEVLEGSWQPRRLVLFRFPSREAIRAFYDDPDYAELKALRIRTSDANIVAVDGWEPSP